MLFRSPVWASPPLGFLRTSSFPPLPAPTFPFVSCLSGSVSHSGLASHLVLRTVRFSSLMLIAFPERGSLSPNLWGLLPCLSPFHHCRTVSQPPASFLGPLPCLFTALSSPLSPEVSATTPSPPHGLCILALARSAPHPLPVRPAHTSLVIALCPASPLSSPPSILFLPSALPASLWVSPLHHSLLFLGPAACLLHDPPWLLTRLSLIIPCCPLPPVSFTPGFHGL